MLNALYRIPLHAGNGLGQESGIYQKSHEGLARSGGCKGRRVAARGVRVISFMMVHDRINFGRLYVCCTPEQNSWNILSAWANSECCIISFIKSSFNRSFSEVGMGIRFSGSPAAL